jgi:hypothetical protein
VSTTSAQSLEHNITGVAFISPPINANLQFSEECTFEVQYINSGFSEEPDVKIVVQLFKTNRDTLYHDTITFKNWPVGETKNIVAGTYTPHFEGFIFKCYSLLSLDMDRSDDTLISKMNITDGKDIKVLSVLAPDSTQVLSEITSFVPACKIKWDGAYTQSKLNARMRVRIHKYLEHSLVFQSDTVIPSISYYDGIMKVEFPSKQNGYDTRSLIKGCYRIAAISTSADDGDHRNDTAYSYITIANKIPVRDMAIDIVYSPLNNSHFDTSIVPIKIKISNDGTSKGENKTFVAKVSVLSDSVIYRDTIVIPVLGMRSTLDTQFTDLVISRKGPYYPEYKLEIAATPPNEDQTWRDTVKSVFSVGEPSKVKLLAITYPINRDTINAGTDIRPKVLLGALWGNDFTKFKVRTEIQHQGCGVKYSSDSTIPSTLDIESPVEYTLPLPRCGQYGIDSITQIFKGDYRLTCFITSSTDSSVKYDSLSLRFTVNGSTIDYYISIDSILFPTKKDKIRKDNAYRPLVLIRNNGPFEIFDIKFFVRNNDTYGYSYYWFDKEIASLPSGDSMLIECDPFVPKEVGSHSISVQLYDFYLPFCFDAAEKGHFFNVTNKPSAVPGEDTDSSDILSFEPNFPNPFSATTTLSYEVASAGYVTMRMLDVVGVTIEIVMSDVFVSEGKHEVTLDGSHLPSGTYFVEMVFKDTEGRSSRIVKPIIVQKN